VCESPFIFPEDVDSEMLSDSSEEPIDAQEIYGSNDSKPSD
jgi:hypothetical protein